MKEFTSCQESIKSISSKASFTKLMASHIDSSPLTSNLYALCFRWHIWIFRRSTKDCSRRGMIAGRKEPVISRLSWLSMRGARNALWSLPASTTSLGINFSSKRPIFLSKTTGFWCRRWIETCWSEPSKMNNTRWKLVLEKQPQTTPLSPKPSATSTSVRMRMSRPRLCWCLNFCQINIRTQPCSSEVGSL